MIGMMSQNAIDMAIYSALVVEIVTFDWSLEAQMLDLEVLGSICTNSLFQLPEKSASQ